MSKINKIYLKNYVENLISKGNGNHFNFNDVFSYLDIVIKDKDGSIITNKMIKENLTSYLFMGERFNKLSLLGNKSDKRIYDKHYKRLKIERCINIGLFKTNGLSLLSVVEKNYGLEYIYEFEIISRISIDGKREVNSRKYKVHLKNYIFTLLDNGEIDYFSNKNMSFIL